MTRTIYRHGDVNLVEVSAEDYDSAKQRGRHLPASRTHVLARGEATGSVHQLTVDSPDALELIQDGETLWLKLSSPGTLTHTADHEPLTIAPNRYRQVSEREMDWFSQAVRSVVD